MIAFIGTLQQRSSEQAQQQQGCSQDFVFGWGLILAEV